MGMSEKFVYDSTGNIIQLDDIVLEYSPGDRLQRRGNTQYLYDGNGRLVRKIENCESQTPKVWEFGWDAEDQLRKVTTPAGEIWEYKYDALGRRIVKQGQKTATQFVWNGNVIVHQVEDKKVLYSSWVFDPHSFAPLCKVQNEQLYSVICDHLGTPRELLDVEGKVVWSVSYKAWGEVEEVQVEEVDCPVRFQGQWVDEESGFYYNRFRYYEAQSGRFISADPIRLLGGLNNYFYGINSINWLDPLGLNKCKAEAKENLRRLGLEGVELAGSSYNKGRKSLEKAGFVLMETTSTGRKIFKHPKTRTEVYYDPHGKALVPGQKPHWEIKDVGGQRYTRSGRPVRGESPIMGGKHIPGG